jgi:glycine/sarcosine N-methyltransferase
VVEGFYDDLAEDYHLIFADWERSMAYQAEVLEALLREHDRPVRRVLDAACGIGMQALPLARAGYDVTATDVSAAAVDRCAREAARRGLLMQTAVNDMRSLGAGRFDAVIAFDNALPHLLTDHDLGLACASLHRALEPGGLLLASIRDYDAILVDRPPGELPRAHGDHIVVQLWEWTEDERYTLRHLILTRGNGTWRGTERRTTYRALRRETLSTALGDAGFADVRWRLPGETGFYQPIVSARSASPATATGRTPR